MRQSVLVSKLYLGVKEKVAKMRWGFFERPNSISLTRGLLQQIQDKCSSMNIELLVLCIPSPIDARKQIDLREKYGDYFAGLSYRFPSITSFSPDDYDGMEKSNHFTNSGHRKWYKFMKREIQEFLRD